MNVCQSCKAGGHWCEGNGCECFCDAPDAYWSPEIDRCATCNEPYDGTEPPDRHIARAHVEAMARERRTFRRPS